MRKEVVMDMIGSTIALIIMAAMFWAAMVVGSAWENQVRCERGAVQFCQGGSDGKIHE